MKKNYDYLVIGAGPAGLQLGYFLGKNNRDYLILEKESEPGFFFKKFPRHRKLLSINKVYTGTDDREANLRWDWNSLLSDSEKMLFKHYSKEYYPDHLDLQRYLVDFANHFDIRIKHNTTIKNVSKSGGVFTLTDEEGDTYNGKRLIVATGLTKQYIPDIPGIELCDSYATHSVNPEDYINKRVLIVGKGNSGFETANNLTETAAVIHICSPESVDFAWQTHYVGHLRAINNHFLDTYQLKSQNAVLDATITKIEKNNGMYKVYIAYSHAKGQTRVFSYDNIIVCTGFGSSTSIFDESCYPDMTRYGLLPAQTSEWESVNVKDMYFAGTLMAACDFKKTMSGFIHGFRHNIQILSNLFEQKYHGKTLPCHKFAATPEKVLGKVINRINTAPGIFLQPGFIGDVLVVSEKNGSAIYYEDTRLDYVCDSQFGKNSHYYTISLEYGKASSNPFCIERDPDPDKGKDAPYLHPIIRRYSQNDLVAEHHIQDNLENQWSRDIYVKPALAFFKQQLGV